MKAGIRRVIAGIGEWLQILGAFTEALFETHKLVRRVLVGWSLWLITLVILKFVSLMTAIDTATVSGVGTIVGILSTVLVFYIRSRELDQQKEPKK